MAVRRLILPLLLAGLVAPAAALALTANVVRSAKPSEKIEGLKLKSTKVPVKTSAKEPGKYRVTLSLLFAPKGRVLLKDDAPLLMPDAKDENKKLKAKIDVELSGKSTPVRLIAMEPTGELKAEKILVVFERWKAVEPPKAAEIPELVPTDDGETYRVERGGKAGTAAFVANGKQVWQPGDLLCLVARKGGKVCAQVATLRDDGAVVQLNAKRKFRKGELIKVTPEGKPEPPPPREVAQVEPPQKITVESVAKEPASGKSYHLSVMTFLSTFSRDSTDAASGATATLTSSLNLGGEVAGSFALNRSIEPTAFVRLGRFAVTPFAGNFTNTSQLLWEFGVGMGYYPLESRRLLLTGTFGFKDESVLRATSANDFSLESVGVPAFRLRGAYEVFANAPFSVWGEASFSYSLPGLGNGYLFKQGVGYGAKLLGVRRFKEFDLRGSVFFLGESVGTSILTYTQTEFGLEIGVGF